MAAVIAIVSPSQLSPALIQSTSILRIRSDTDRGDGGAVQHADAGQVLVAGKKHFRAIERSGTDRGSICVERGIDGAAGLRRVHLPARLRAGAGIEGGSGEEYRLKMSNAWPVTPIPAQLGSITAARKRSPATWWREFRFDTGNSLTIAG